MEKLSKFEGWKSHLRGKKGTLTELGVETHLQDFFSGYTNFIIEFRNRLEQGEIFSVGPLELLRSIYSFTQDSGNTCVLIGIDERIAEDPRFKKVLEMAEIDDQVINKLQAQKQPHEKLYLKDLLIRPLLFAFNQQYEKFGITLASLAEANFEYCDYLKELAFLAGVRRKPLASASSMPAAAAPGAPKGDGNGPLEDSNGQKNVPPASAPAAAPSAPVPAPAAANPVQGPAPAETPIEKYFKEATEAIQKIKNQPSLFGKQMQLAFLNGNLTSIVKTIPYLALEKPQEFLDLVFKIINTMNNSLEGSSFTYQDFENLKKAVAYPEIVEKLELTNVEVDPSINFHLLLVRPLLLAFKKRHQETDMSLQAIAQKNPGKYDVLLKILDPIVQKTCTGRRSTTPTSPTTTSRRGFRK